MKTKRKAPERRGAPRFFCEELPQLCGLLGGVVPALPPTVEVDGAGPNDAREHPTAKQQNSYLHPFVSSR